MFKTAYVRCNENTNYLYLFRADSLNRKRERAVNINYLPNLIITQKFRNSYIYLK